MNQPIIESLPELYQNFLPNIFFEETPSETIATCHDCIMCKDWEAKKARGEKYFTPEGRCCTFFPTIPNYLIGALLSDDSESMKEGVSRVKDIIDSKVGVTPYYLRPPVAYTAKYKAFSKFNFGLASDLICPFNDRSNRNCTIWKHRNAVCLQYYCKSVGAKTGKSFWNATRNYLSKSEELLSAFACHQMGVRSTAKEYSNLRADGLDGKVNITRYQSIWGDWIGREVEFYKKTFSLVDELDTKSYATRFAKYLKTELTVMKDRKSEFESAVMEGQ